MHTEVVRLKQLLYNVHCVKRDVIIAELAHHVGITNIAEKKGIWLCRDSNHGPLANRENALPLSYTRSLSNCYEIIYE